MPTTASLLAALHLALALAWLAALLLPLARPSATPAAERHQRFAAAALAAFSAPYLFHGGWWTDLPGRYLLPAFAVTDLAFLVRPRGSPGMLALTAFAGFYMALGALSLRNATPLPPPLAAKALLLAAALLVQAHAQPGPRRTLLLVALLLAAAAAGLQMPPSA